MQINRRERLLAIGLAAALAVWAFYTLAVQPTRERIRTLQRIIPEKQTQLAALQARSAEYAALQGKLAQLQTRLASQESNFQLLPFLETTIEQHRLSKHVAAMEQDGLPSQGDYAQVTVTIELHEISLKQLVDFLSDVQASPSVVRIGSLHIRKDPKDDALLDSTVGICSPALGVPDLAPQTVS